MTEHWINATVWFACCMMYFKTVSSDAVTSTTRTQMFPAVGIIGGENRDLMFATSGSVRDLFLIYDASKINVNISRSGSLRDLFPDARSDESVPQKKLSVGAIAGIVVGSVVGFLIIIGVCCCCYCLRNG
ncbi:hypothetical protein DPMN_180400 [Dreissena polymorpha]|uniref:Uncharacterized protein n=1 Tax=Dreissena polymorpha TaxID=45954 RepID=A0A9D4IPC2_DREPO|nr:hypothetical protein DPMN_180400 [Dreissena polymorpha]